MKSCIRFCCFGLAFVATSQMSFAATWTFRTQSNLLKQTEVIAEWTPRSQRPGELIRFSCSTFSGPIVILGLGPKSFEQFTKFNSDSQTAIPNKFPLSVKFQKIDPVLSPLTLHELDLLAEVDPTEVTASVFQITGGEALTFANSLTNADQLSVTSQFGTVDLDVGGSDGPIKSALDACPFKE